MDYLQIPIEGNQYTLEVYKRKRFYSMTKFGQYVVSLVFKNSIGNTVLQIDTTEKEYFQMIQSLNYFAINIGSLISDIIHFDSSTPVYRLYVFGLESTYSPYPTEEEPRCGISIYQGNKDNQGSVHRLYMEMTYFNLEELVYDLFKLIEDLDYIGEMNESFLDDLFESYMDNESYLRYRNSIDIGE